MRRKMTEKTFIVEKLLVEKSREILRKNIWISSKSLEKFQKNHPNSFLIF